MLFIVFISIICIPMIVYGNKHYSSLINPINVFVGINYVSLLFSIFCNMSISYSFSISMTIAIMFISFFIGIVLCKSKRTNNKYTEIFSDNSNTKLYKIIVCASIIYNAALLFYLKNMFSIYSIVDFFVNMNEMNQYVQSDEFEGGVFNYIVPIGVPLSLCILYYTKRNGWSILLIIQYALCFAHCISPRRAELFTLIVISLIYIICSGDYFKSSNSKIKVYLVFILFAFAIIGIMSYTQELMGKASDLDINLLNYRLPNFLVDPFCYFTFNYPYLEVKNFEQLMEPSTFMGSTFRLFYIIANMFGAHIDVTTDFALEFEQVCSGVVFNTAPLLYYSFKDLGYLFFIDFIILGYLSHKAFLGLRSNILSDRLLGCIFFCLLLFSFREYKIIYLSFALALLYSLSLKVLFRQRRLYL